MATIKKKKIQRSERLLHICFKQPSYLVAKRFSTKEVAALFLVLCFQVSSGMCYIAPLKS